MSCDLSKTAPDQIPTPPPAPPETEPETLTIVEVDVLGDLVPRAVVEVPHLLFVLHHAGGLALLLILESYVVLDGFKVFPMLENKPMVKAEVKTRQPSARRRPFQRKGTAVTNQVFFTALICASTPTLLP